MKIFAVGMNYVSHNKELHPTLLEQDVPTIFTKADSSWLPHRKPFFVPDHLGRIEYEAEVVVRICKLGKNIPERFAHRYYDAFTVGIDFTARELQAELRSKGLPWDLAKGFDGAAAVGDWIEKDKLPESDRLRFRLERNGRTVQSASTAEMLFGVDFLVHYISKYFTLKTGDLIFTGTPAGTGAIMPEDRLDGWLEERHVLQLKCK